MAEENAPEGKKKGKLKTLIVMGVAVVIAILLSVAATLFFLGDSADMDAVTDGEDEGVEKQQNSASYYRFREPFIVTLADERQRYLQVHLAVVMRDQDISDQLKRHNPTLRSRIQTLLANQTFSDLREAPAREALRESITGTINQVMAEEAAAEMGATEEGEEKEESPPGIEQVLYTNFVMQ